MFTSWHMGAQKCKCAQCTLLTYTYIHNEKVSGNVTVKLHEGSVSATERHPIWCSIINNWHSNITTIISIDVTIYGNKCTQLCYATILREENPNKINFVFYFLRSVYRCCLFLVFTERLMLLFLIIIRLFKWKKTTSSFLRTIFYMEKCQCWSSSRFHIFVYLLFLIYINDLTKDLSSSAKLSVNDTSLFSVVIDIQTLPIILIKIFKE